jgi:hypothetical protein
MYPLQIRDMCVSGDGVSVTPKKLRCLLNKIYFFPKIPDLGAWDIWSRVSTLFVQTEKDRRKKKLRTVERSPVIG